MKQLLKIIVCVTLIIIGVSVTMGAQSIDINNSEREAAIEKMKEADRQEVLREMEAVYTQRSGKEPTKENLLESIKTKNAKGDELLAVNIALHIILLKKDKLQLDPDTISKLIQECYYNYYDSDYRSIRVSCANILMRIDKPKGVELSRKILDDPKMDLRSKLNTARLLINAKELIGYPVLQEGLIASKDQLRTRLAIPLLEAFFTYDGTVYGEKGEKVDILALIAKAKKDAKEQKIIDDLEKAELKFNEQKKK
jgi:hypothetical protein